MGAKFSFRSLSTNLNFDFLRSDRITTLHGMETSTFLEAAYMYIFIRSHNIASGSCAWI